MPFKQGFDFCLFSNFVTHGADDFPVYADVMGYPHVSSQGTTFGWETPYGEVGEADRNNTVDARLASIHYMPNNGTTALSFRIDLPGPGNYNVRAALGDMNDPHVTSYAVYDDTTLILTMVNGASTTAGGYFFDASGVERTAAAWPASNVAVPLTFASSICRVKQIANSSGGSDCIAYFYIEEAAGADIDASVDETATAADTVLPLQTLLPASDVSNAGTWVPKTGTYLYAMLNVRGSGNYIVTPNNPSGAVCEVKASAGDVLNITGLGYIEVDAQCFGGDVDLTVALMEGSTEITTRTQTIGTDATTFAIQLTAAEVGAISDVTDLRWRYTATVSP